MGWVENLAGQIVGLDTAPLIYYFEDRAPHADILEPFFQSFDKGSLRVVTSMITLTEVLVHPLRNANEKLASEYHDVLLSHPHVMAVPVNSAIAQAAAELRAEWNLKTADAIQLATALAQGHDIFHQRSRLSQFLRNSNPAPARFECLAQQKIPGRTLPGTLLVCSETKVLSRGLLLHHDG